MPKLALFVYNGDPMCFVHVLLNALDLHARGLGGRIVVEGAATKLIPELVEEANPLAGLWKKAVAAGLVDGVCRACAHKMGTLKEAQAQGLALLDDMSGHPGMAAYREKGFEVVAF